MKRLRLWTDGCCIPEPGGIGGWAFVAEHNGRVLHRASGTEPESAANLMELKAAIEALRWSDHGFHTIEVLSDSLHVIEGVNDRMGRWRKKNWRRGKKGGGEPIFGADLWKELDGLLRSRSFTPNVTWSWVRGHSVHEFNRDADLLASEAVRAYRREMAQRRNGHRQEEPAQSGIITVARSDRR